jgi:hypothetical protein
MSSGLLCSRPTLGAPRSWRLRLTLCYFMVLLSLCVTVTGCGASRSAPRFGEHPVKYAHNGVRILAKGRLPSGTFFVIAALRYEFMGRTYSRLGLRYEPPSEHRFVGASGWSGGPSLESGRGEARSLVMNIARSCSGAYRSALAYGLLRDSKDTVTAREHRTAIVMKRVAVPANFEANGVLVYTLLGRGPTNVVTRTPSGRIVSDESYPQESTTCR